jgi:exopolyphosphatase/guanosine-5'-triphosphate,3'-diphosphate pyrophosphatase
LDSRSKSWPPEEARLIYLGVAHSLPVTGDKRLVVDIGGGSTECIIGAGYKPHRSRVCTWVASATASNTFPVVNSAKATSSRRETAARLEVQTIAREFSASRWKEAVGSSGTARALGDILEANGWSEGGITAEGLDRLKNALLRLETSIVCNYPDCGPTGCRSCQVGSRLCQRSSRNCRSLT